jgi:hypothetical protein
VASDSRTPADGEMTGSGELVLPSAPYLALIGRVCPPSGRCSEPFPLGRLAVVCPSLVGVTGSLELWTNNRIHVDGRRTRMSFSGVAGGFSIQTEPTWASACEPSSVAAALSGDTATRLGAGEVLNRPEYAVSNRTNAWKPFFLPLHLPLRIRAVGEMRPQGDLEPTGPDGISVPDVPRWNYPGSYEIVVDREHPLLVPTMPYQALIGRVCSHDECAPPFLVGSDRVICADPEHRDRLELWVNQITSPPGLLEQETPLTLTAFERQRRVGEYRFTVSQASPGACGW